MQRIPPSEQIRKQYDLLNHGLARQQNLIGALVQLEAQLVVQELLEQKTTEQLRHPHYQHRKPGEPLRGYENGYEPGRLRTAEGDVAVQVPQVRDWLGKAPYRSDLMAFLRGNSDVLSRLAVEMYARGLSVRTSEGALWDATGELLLSRTAVSELTETLWEDYQAFWARDLSTFAVEYLFIDAVYQGLRQWGCSQGLLCA